MASGWDWPSEEYKDDPEKLKIHREQRMSRGYSVFDWWCFDTYISGVIASAVENFSTGHGYPGDFSNMEEFEAFCKSIYEPLAFYASDEYSRLKWVDQEPKYMEAVEAMKKFAERLGSWWD